MTRNSINLPNDRPGMITRLVNGEYITLLGEHADAYLRHEQLGTNTETSYSTDTSKSGTEKENNSIHANTRCANLNSGTGKDLSADEYRTVQGLNLEPGQTSSSWALPGENPLPSMPLKSGGGMDPMPEVPGNLSLPEQIEHYLKTIKSHSGSSKESKES